MVLFNAGLSMLEATLLGLERDLLEGAAVGLLEKGNGFLAVADVDAEAVLA